MLGVLGRIDEFFGVQGGVSAVIIRQIDFRTRRRGRKVHILKFHRVPSVKFTSEPREASLMIDGNLMGKTPIDVPLDPKDLIGGIIIQASIEDYHPAHFKLTASPILLKISAFPGDYGETHTKCHNGELQHVHIVLKNFDVPPISNPSTVNSSITAAPQN